MYDRLKWIQQSATRITSRIGIANISGARATCTTARHPRDIPEDKRERVFSLSLSLPKRDSSGEIVQRRMIAGVRGIAIIGALPGGP